MKSFVPAEPSDLVLTGIGSPKIVIQSIDNDTDNDNGNKQKISK